VEVCSKVQDETLPPHRPTDHWVDQEPGFTLPYWWTYNHSEFELKTLKAYIEKRLPSGFIQWSSSPAAVPIMFKKK